METKDKLWTFQTIREEWNEIWNLAVAVRNRNQEARMKYAMWFITWYMTERLWQLNTQKSIFSIVRRRTKVAHPESSSRLISSSVFNRKKLCNRFILDEFSIYRYYVLDEIRAGRTKIVAISIWPSNKEKRMNCLSMESKKSFIMVLY